MTGVADPTLEGCPEDNVYKNAFTAVDYKGSGGSKVPEANREQCRKLLQAAKPFWNEASYAHPRHSKSRIKSNPIPFANKPTNLPKLREALQVGFFASIKFEDEIIDTVFLTRLSKRLKANALHLLKWIAT